MVDNCDNCGLPIDEDDTYIAARRRVDGFSDPFVFIHVNCPKDYRTLAEDALAASGNPVGLAILALCEKLDELPLIALAVNGPQDD